MVLGHSLKDRGAKAKLVVLVTIDQVSSETISELKVCIPDTKKVIAETCHRLSTMILYLFNRSRTGSRRIST